MYAYIMRNKEAAATYEQKTLTFQNGQTTDRLRVISILNSGSRFCTAIVQRINKDGSVDARDTNQGRERTFAHSAIVEVS